MRMKPAEGSKAPTGGSGATVPSSTARLGRGGRRGRPYALMMAVSVAVVVAVAAGFVLTDGFHFGTRSATTVLIGQGSYYSLPGSQYNSVEFTTSGSAVLHGTFSDTLGVTVYVFTPAELVDLSIHNTLDGYAWTSGQVANLSVTTIDVPVTAGEWELTFINPNTYNTTVVGFYTAVTVTPS